MLTRTILIFVLAGSLASCKTPTAGAAPVAAYGRPMLWYRQPATRWLEALPVGNGRLGAMVFGCVDREQLCLEESTFWSGESNDRHENPAAREHLAEIRRLFFDGKYREAVALVQRHMLGRTDNYGTNLPVGDLWLTLRQPAGEVNDYRRELDLDQAIARVEYTIGGVRFSRETLSSHVDGVIAVRLTANKPGQVSFAVKFHGQNPPWQATAQGPSGLALCGDAREKLHSDGKTGVSFSGGIRVLIDGGKVHASGDAVEVESANAATVLVAIDTTYRGRDADELCRRQLDAASRKTYDEIRQAHVADHQRLFRRVAIELNPSGAGSGEGARLPTDRRLDRVRRGQDDPRLAALMFQYGRYLLIAGSREDSPLPINIQGIWNDNLSCNMGWTCDYHLDINVQQNYWPAEVCNLSECHEPLLRLVESLREPGRQTAQKVYGCGGWVCHTVTNAWGFTAPGCGLGWGMHPVGGIWIASALWEHYAFTGDKEFLARRAYPLLKEAAEFFLDYMVEHPKYGYLVTGPSVSPENAFFAPDRHPVGESMGPTHDRVEVYDLLSSCIEASKILGVDGELRSRWEQARAKLPPLAIGKHGQVREWLEDFDEAKPGHRHTSHLAALFPSCQITPRDTPELAKAARVTIERRLAAPHWGDLEFARGNLIAYFARLGDGDNAYRHVLGLLQYDTEANLFTYCLGGVAGVEHHTIVLDGNFSCSAGIAEMLLQSHGGEIRLLPALPRAWPSGHVRGLRARGGFEVDLAWSQGRLSSVTVRSLLGHPATLCYGERIVHVPIEAGHEARFDGELRREGGGQ